MKSGRCENAYIIKTESGSYQIEADKTDYNQDDYYVRRMVIDVTEEVTIVKRDHHHYELKQHKQNIPFYKSIDMLEAAIATQCDDVYQWFECEMWLGKGSQEYASQ